MNNFTAFALGDAWQNPAGHVHSRNCACCKADPFRKDAQRLKADLIDGNNQVSQLLKSMEINPLYFGPDDPQEATEPEHRIIII